MSRYVGRHRRDALPPPETGPVALPDTGNLMLVHAETLTMPAGEPTEVLDAIDEAAAAAARRDWYPRPRDPGTGRFMPSATGPDEQEDAEDQDPQPGDPIRQVPGEKDPDPGV
jgi:hypothetical protein